MNNLSPLEKVIFDAIAVHWMSAIKGVCTCGEVMFTPPVVRGAVQAVTTHRAKVVAEAVEQYLQKEQQ